MGSTPFRQKVGESLLNVGTAISDAIPEHDRLWNMSGESDLTKAASRAGRVLIKMADYIMPSAEMDQQITRELE